MSQGIRRIAGRYELHEQLGAGAMGRVWRADDLKLERVVAVKELLLPSNLDEKTVQQARSRARREARIAARLHHPNAITVHDVVEHDGQPWLIMEYLPSQNLSAVLAQRGPLPVPDVIRIGKHMAAALAAAHQASVLHRDIKPGNVLLGAGGAVKITDFGISRALDDTAATATSNYAGTPAFFSPEVARGEDSGYPSDVFSFGATLYNAVEGTPPFGRTDNSIAQLYRAAAGMVRPPERAGALTPLLAQMLALDPSSRPTMDETAERLAALAKNTAPTPTPVVDLWDQTTASFAAQPPSTAGVRKSRKRAVAGLTAVLVVLVAIVCGAFLYASRADKDRYQYPAAQPGTTTTSPSTVQSPAAFPLINGVANKCLDVPDKATANGTPVTIFVCNGGSNQQWTATAAGELRVYGTKCLDAQLASTQPGTIVMIHDCHGGANQQWTVKDDQSIVGKQSGLCLDVPGADTNFGTPVRLWDCAGVPNQRWRER
ncbi:MAG: serine/threonine protein kinase [Umezawaea sp.]